MLLLAVLVHLVAKTLSHCAVMALLVWQMLVLALLFLLKNVVFKALMFHELISFFIGDLLLHAAILDHLDILGLFLCLGLLDHSTVAVFGHFIFDDLRCLQNTT